MTVTTPTQKQHVEALPVGKVSAVKYKGKLYYVYPTAQKDRIYYGKQAQFNAYKQSLQALQGAQQMAGSPPSRKRAPGPTTSRSKPLMGSVRCTMIRGTSRQQRDCSGVTWP